MCGLYKSLLVPFQATFYVLPTLLQLARGQQENLLRQRLLFNRSFFGYLPCTQ